VRKFCVKENLKVIREIKRAERIHGEETARYEKTKLFNAASHKRVIDAKVRVNEATAALLRCRKRNEGRE
jgi:hypothetical protein